MWVLLNDIIQHMNSIKENGQWIFVDHTFNIYNKNCTFKKKNTSTESAHDVSVEFDEAVFIYLYKIFFFLTHDHFKSRIIILTGLI